MKKVFLSLAFMLMVSLLNAQDLSSIEGVWERGKPKDIKLYAIENSNYKELASAKVGDDGRFILAFYPTKEGFYTLGVSNGKRSSYDFYFKPGDKLSLKVTATSFELTGKDNTPENKEMARWEEFVAPLENLIYRYSGGINTYVDFFPVFEEKEKELAKYKVKGVSNKTFIAAFERYRETNFLDLAVSYLFQPRPAHPQGEDFPDYYRALDMKTLGKDTFILNYPEGLRLLGQVKMVHLWTNTEMSKEERNKWIAAPESGIIDNEELMNNMDPTVRGELVLLYGKSKKTLAGFDLYKDEYMKYLANDSQKKRMEDIRLPLIKNAKGDAAIDFAFADVNGKVHALSDYKGKVVYVDVWATWCGPCKQELPHLKKLEEEYKDNKDIVFMGVSVDKAKDMQKWKNFLVAEELPGIQIFGGDESNEKLMKPYKIGGIPRFILVDREGNLVSANAPRPSSSEIRPLLNDVLKK